MASNLPPGVVLDCLVAELVYGYPIVRTEYNSADEGYRAVLDRIATFPAMIVSPSVTGNEDGTATEGPIGVLYKDKIAHIIWSPSKNPTFALKVVERMGKHRAWLQCSSPEDDSQWEASFYQFGDTPQRCEGPIAIGDTFPHAVCLAAVAWMESRNDKKRDSRAANETTGNAPT